MLTRLVVVLAVLAVASGCTWESRPDGASARHLDAARPHPVVAPATERAEVIVPVDDAVVRTPVGVGTEAPVPTDAPTATSPAPVTSPAAPTSETAIP